MQFIKGTPIRDSYGVIVNRCRAGWIDHRQCRYYLGNGVSVVEAAASGRKAAMRILDYLNQMEIKKVEN